MSLNQLNFFIGVVLGVALAYLLRSGAPPGREAKTSKVWDTKELKKFREAAG